MGRVSDRSRYYFTLLAKFEIDKIQWDTSSDPNTLDCSVLDSELLDSFHFKFEVTTKLSDRLGKFCVPPILCCIGCIGGTPNFPSPSVVWAGTRKCR